jgi:serine/threonine-protein kinase HipA
MKSNFTSLEILLYNEPIGALSLLPSEHIALAFYESYVENQNRPILSLSFKDKFGDLITDMRPTKVQVPSVWGLSGKKI